MLGILHIYVVCPGPRTELLNFPQSPITITRHFVLLSAALFAYRRKFEIVFVDHHPEGAQEKRRRGPRRVSKSNNNAVKSAEVGKFPRFRNDLLEVFKSNGTSLAEEENRMSLTSLFLSPSSTYTWIYGLSWRRNLHFHLNHCPYQFRFRWPVRP